jgi:DNA-binding transcriptional regulator GbsR (MarR family)
MGDAMKTVRTLSTDEEIRIVSDPYRLRIIAVYKESAKPMTVKEVAVAMNEVPAKVHYHVKKLLSIHILELDHVEVIKGIHAKYYKLVTASFRLDYSSQPENRSSLIDHSAVMLGNMIDDFKRDVNLAYENRKQYPTEVLTELGFGFFTQEVCYFDKETFKQISDDMSELMEKYQKRKLEEDGKYSVFFGAIRKDKPKGE